MLGHFSCYLVKEGLNGLYNVSFKSNAASILILAGVKSVMLHGEISKFYFRENVDGKSRVLTTVLNNAVAVTALTNKLTLGAILWLSGNLIVLKFLRVIAFSSTGIITFLFVVTCLTPQLNLNNYVTVLILLAFITYLENERCLEFNLKAVS